MFLISILQALPLPEQYRHFLPRFYQLAAVSILANMMVPLAGLFDSAFLGHLADIHPLAGVILASILFDYLYRLLKFLRNSTNAMAAEAIGQNDQTGVLLAVIRSGLIALSIAVVILLLQSPIRHLGFAILSGAADSEISGVEYFNARIWGAPAVLLNFVLIGWFLGCEKKAWVLWISLVGNGTNVLLDYVLIMRWGWGSMGAGLATALSQYMAFFVAILGVGLSIDWNCWSAAFKSAFDRAAFQSALVLKGNILIRFLALISAYAIFTNLSATLGTQVLTENGLLLQIALLSQFTVQGIGLTTQTLVGYFNGKGASEKLLPVLKTAIINSIFLALIFALLSVLLPQQIFGLLTNHGEVIRSIAQFTPWLLPLLVLTAVAFMLEGYFIGLKDGKTLRNSSLLALGLGFAPLALAGWYFHNNHLLWTALIFYMAVLTAALGIQLFFTQPSIRQLSTTQQ